MDSNLSRNKVCQPGLIEEHGGLVGLVVKKLAPIYDEDPEDLMQIGYIGLMKAAKGFRPEKGFKFSTYAVPVITGEIKMYMRDQGKIKVSRGLKADMYKVRRAEMEYIKCTGMSPRINDIQIITGLDLERVTEVIQALDSLVNMGELGEGDIWTDGEDKQILKMDISRAMNELTDEEKRVIYLRYYKDLTQVQTAKILNLNQVSVSRIEKKSLQKMGEKLQKKV